MRMEININCDLGDKSKHHSNKYDPDLLEIVNSANVACGYHAGDEQTMNQVVKISKKNGVSIGAHPSFNDPENFGRERMNLSESEIKKLIIDQYEILQKIASSHGESVSHVKPHGALNNMACEDIELATILAQTIKDIDKDIIYLVPTGSKMQEAAKKLDMKFACEIFGYFFLKEKINLITLFSICLAMTGVLLMVGNSLSPGELSGNLAAFTMPITFAVLIMIVRKFPSVDMVPAQFVAGVSSCLIGFLLSTKIMISPHDIFLGFLAGFFQVGFGFIFITIGARTTPSAMVGIIMLSESVLGPIWAFLFVSERPSVFGLIGGAIILSAVLLQFYSLLSKQKKIVSD